MPGTSPGPTDAVAFPRVKVNGGTVTFGTHARYASFVISMNDPVSGFVSPPFATTTTRLGAMPSVPSRCTACSHSRTVHTTGPARRPPPFPYVRQAGSVPSGNWNTSSAVRGRYSSPPQA
ncbi:hypothetical protein [Streptomyces sp. CoH27]|uniref:hypothetical protein n=1 Tax=Streptomyces sp. CoH27 TaxID=2875763 RepID=UPI0027E164E5|nr:hypothetical protein [Streptomyces sp. CoH27]